MELTASTVAQPPNRCMRLRVTAYRDVAAADPQKSGFDDYPNVGAGLVTDNMGNFILAGTKSYWYAGGFSNTNVNPAHNDPVVAIAKALAAM